MRTTSVPPVTTEHRTSDAWCLVAPTLPETGAAQEWAARPRTGAVVTFQGVVRDHGHGRDGVRAIDYEAYDAVALARLVEIATVARSTWPGVATVALWHRTGLVALSEASVVVTVGGGHRDEAFDAARFCIDVLKRTVPVWKLEHGRDGLHRSEGGTSLAVPVTDAAREWLAAHHDSAVGCGSHA